MAAAVHLHPLRVVLNAAARLVVKKRKFDSIAPTFDQLALEILRSATLRAVKTKARKLQKSDMLQNAVIRKGRPQGTSHL